jgi:transposase-like protein
MLLLSDPQVAPALAEARLLHPSGAGFVSVARKCAPAPGHEQGRWREKLYPAIAQAMRGVPDVYLSQASFATPRRLVSNAKMLRCAYVDLDVYKLGLRADDATVQAVSQAAARAGIPQPTYISASGRGLYAKWVFRDPITSALLPQWNALQSVIIHLYKQLGADPAARDAARVLRLAQSVNSKSGQTVRIAHETGQLYSFQDLCAIASRIEVPRAMERVRGESRRIRAKQLVLAEEPMDFGLLSNYSVLREPFMMRAFSHQSLNWSRFLDLRDLAFMRGGIARGSRDLMLFWMTNFLAHAGVITPDNLWSEVEQLLAAFPSAADFDPIGDASLTTLIDRIKAHHRGEKIVHRGHEYSPLYTPTSDTLINMLEITPEEEASLRTVISGGEKRRRSDLQSPGRAQRRNDRKSCQEAAASMKRDGAPVSRIAKELGKPPSTVYRWLRDDPAAGTSYVETRGRRAIQGVPGEPPAPLTEREIHRRTHLRRPKPHLDQAAHWSAQRLQQWRQERRARQAVAAQAFELSLHWKAQVEAAAQAQSALAAQVLLSSLREKSARRPAAATVSNMEFTSVSSNVQRGPPMESSLNRDTSANPVNFRTRIERMRAAGRAGPPPTVGTAPSIPAHPASGEPSHADIPRGLQERPVGDDHEADGAPADEMSPGQRARARMRVSAAATALQSSASVPLQPHEEDDGPAWEDHTRPEGSAFSPEDWTECETENPGCIVLEVFTQPEQRALVPMNRDRLDAMRAIMFDRSLLVSLPLAKQYELARQVDVRVLQLDKERGLFEYALVMSHANRLRNPLLVGSILRNNFQEGQERLHDAGPQHPRPRSDRYAPQRG